MNLFKVHLIFFRENVVRHGMLPVVSTRKHVRNVRGMWKASQHNYRNDDQTTTGQLLSPTAVSLRMFKGKRHIALLSGLSIMQSYV